MSEFRRIINRWMLALVVIICFFCSIIFYQLNKETEYEEHKVSTRMVYSYYNQMLKDYYDNLDAMDEIHAKVNARAKLYMIYNMEQWSRLKSEDEELYNAGRYEEKIQRYRNSQPEIVAYYEDLQQNHKDVLDKYIEDSDAINMALDIYDATYDYVGGYDELINGYIEQGNSMLMTEIYSDKSSFEHINILKSKYDFRKLLDIDVSPDNSKAVDAVVTSGSYINIFILLVVFICVFRYFDDRKNGLGYIIYAARKGRAYLSLVRILILAFVSAISTLCAYICVFIISFRIYGGFEYMGNSLQSYEKYATICFTDSKWVFVAAMLALSALAVFITGLIVWLLVSLSDNVSAGMGIAVIIIGISYVMYMGISDKSRFVALKNINIWNWIIPSGIIASYKNIGVGKYIISHIRADVAVEVILVLVLCAGGICVNSLLKHGKKITLFSKLKYKLTAWCQSVLSHMPVLVMELYKLLWVKKGIVVLAIAVVIVSNTGIKKGYTYDSDLAVAMKYYSEAKDMQLSDELSDIVYRYEQESEYWNDRLKQINTAFANETKEFTREDMNEATMQVSLYKKGLEEIHRNINNLEYLKGKNITGEVTMPFAVEEMLGEKLYSHEAVYGLLAVIVLIFIIFSIVSGEKKQNMLISIHTAKRGRLSWCMMKLCAVLIVSICIGVVIFIPDIVNITRVYKIDDMQTAIQNYPRFSFVPIKMSLMAYLICNIIWKLVLLMAIAGIVVLISTMSGYVLSLVVSLALVLPQLLYMLGFNLMYYISIVSPLLVEENWGRGINQLNGIMLVAAGLVCWVISVRRIVKKGH
mgnify:CR=1 FL=1